LKLELYKMKMVDQENPRDEPVPRDARLLAQRNRDVKDETRARHTNLERHHDKTQLSAKTPKRIGSLTRQDKTSARLPERAAKEEAGSSRRVKEPAPPPREVARRPPQPEQAEEKASLLAMRNRKPDQDREVLQPDRPRVSFQGELAIHRPRPVPPRPEEGRASESARARPRLKLQLSPQDADRVFGRQWAAELKQRNQRRGSQGPESKRWAQIKSALENYLPEVKEGNQTALKTRAHPYAKFIAAMHRKIHPLWGDGFLEDLERLPAHNAFNDFSRMVKLEIVLDNRGNVVKAGVVQPSGFLPYDVAALDVIYQADPFPTPPQAILSPDGRVYMHWRFHRDHRQCGTFLVDPFILASPPGGRQDRASTGGAPHDEGRTGRALGRREDAQGQSQVPRPLKGTGLDDRARGPATAWIVGFGKGSLDRMVRASAVPFTASGRPVAKTLAELRSVYAALVAETADRRPPADPELLSAAGLRQKLGSLPRGVEPGEDRLYVVARYGGQDLILILGRSEGAWAVVGLAR
jgi:TonB family protein